MLMRILSALLRRYTEREAKKHTIAEWRSKLDESQQGLADRFARSPGSEANLRQARHVIGIERWGQRRLRSALGEPLDMGEYDPYSPDDLVKMTDLQEAFLTARAETLRVIDELQKAAIPPDHLIPHNDMGNLTVRGWLHYLNEHALREGMRIRPS